jgi:hypothetical protein
MERVCEGRSGFIFAAVIIGCAAAFFAWYPISDGDIFWHLAAGREIVQAGGAPHSDPFSFTSRPEWKWIDLHWLYQLCSYGVYRVLGMRGIVVLNSILSGLAAALLFSAVAPRGRAAWLSIPLWMAALFEIRYLVPHRPVVFSLLFFAAFVFMLERYSRTGRNRFLFVLVILQIAWVNCQPLFILGPALFAAWFAGEWAGRATGFFRETGMEVKTTPLPVIAAGLLLLAASLVNPYGYEAFSLAFLHFGRTDPSIGNIFATSIPENRALFSMIGTAWARYVYATLAITLLALVLVAIRPRAVRLSQVVVSAAMLCLALRSQRNIVLYFFALLPFMTVMIGRVWDGMAGGRRGSAVRWIAISAGLALAMASIHDATAHLGMLRACRAAGPMAPFSFPVGSVEYLERHPVTGRVFNADRHGGYLLWKRYPPHRVFADTRYAIRPAAFFVEYLALIDSPELFDAVRRKFDLTAALVPLAPDSRYLPFAAALARDPRWRLVHIDPASVLFVKDSLAPTPEIMLQSPEVVDSIVAAIGERWRLSPSLAREGNEYFSSFLRNVSGWE